MPLSLNNWNSYQNKFIFEEKKELIKKYSKIFVDIQIEDLERSWIEVLKKYFLQENGEIYIIEELKKGKSFRLNSSITALTNNVLDYDIKANTISSKISQSFYISSKKSTLPQDIMSIIKTLRLREKDITILSSELEDIKYVEENLSFQKTLSFITTKEEKEFIEDSLDLHWFQKNRMLNFNSKSEQLKMATVQAFKGLESNVIFFILTPNTSKEQLYSAITRAKEKLYIFNCDYTYSDKLRLNMNEVFLKTKIDFENKIYIALLPFVKEKILEEYFKKEYEEYRNITLDRDNQVLNRFSKAYTLFFERIFSSSQTLSIYNFVVHKDKEQLAITHDDTNIILILEQSLDKNDSNTKDNYLVCVKIENKNKFILTEGLLVLSQLCFPERIDRNRHSSRVNINKAIIDISTLMKEVEQLLPITQIEDTLEYQKWKVYLELLESKLLKNTEPFQVEFIYVEDAIVKFKKIKHSKLKKNDELLFDDKDTKKNKFGKVDKIQNGFVYIELDNSFKEFNQNKLEVYINNIGEKVQLDTLRRGLKDIKYNDFRFYIFGNQKLSLVKNWKNLEITFKNKNLNINQKESIKKALVSEKMFMIQGPPGTGKTSVISEIAYQETIKGKKVLISSESNDAIENALERLDDNLFYPLLYQSMSRVEKSISIDLPIEKSIGNFYKKRILKKLKHSINNIKTIEDDLEFFELELMEKDEKIRKKIEDFKKIEDDENEIRGYVQRQKENIGKFTEEYEKKVLKQKNEIIFLDTLEEFQKELNLDRHCENELKEVYLKKANIVGATLSQIGKVSKKLNNSNLFDVVIIDEVSKATPIELNLAILKAKKIILVGDQKQLPPMLNRDVTLEEFADNIFRNSDSYRNKKEVKKELYEHKTVFEKLIERNPHSYTQLTTQYRMHEDIQRAINQFYDEDLECGVNKNSRKNQHKLFNSYNLVWVDTSAFEEKRIGTSFENKGEVAQTKKILEQLNQEYESIDFKPTVGVISFYGRQVSHLSSIKNNFQNIKVDFGTVDTFQGQERDFIIASMVRANSRRDIGFARSLNRINVAFSRAKQLLIILGSTETFIEINKNDDNDIKKAKEVYRNIFNISSLEGTL